MSFISSKEIDGDVKPLLIETFDRFIRILRSVFFVHCFTKGKHSKRSYHYKGLAGDGHKGAFKPDRIPNAYDEFVLIDNLTNLIYKENKSIFEQAILARLSGFKGVGIYPNWKPSSGLHLDLRDDELAWIAFNVDYLRKLLENVKSDQVYIYLK